MNLPTLRDFDDFCHDTGFNPGTWTFDAPCVTGKSNAPMNILVQHPEFGSAISSEWDSCWIEEATHRVAHLTRAHRNKHARHAKRPDGRPRFR